MTPDLPKDERAALEASLTALLLGELPHEQAAALHQKLAQDAELAKLYEQLKHTINLVRETVASPAAQTADQPTPLKLSDQRRQKLLQQFKTVAPKEFAPPRRRAMPWLVPVGIAAALVVIVGGLLLPAWSASKSPRLGGGFHTRYLLSESESAATAKPLAAMSRHYLAQERVAPETEVRRELTFTPLASAPASATSKSSGVAIVLPKAAEVADATAAPLGTEGGKPWAGSATLRGFYDDSLGRSSGVGGRGGSGGGGMGGGGLGGGGYGGVAGGAAATKNGPTEVNAAGFLFGKLEAAGVFQAGKPVDNFRLGQPLGGPFQPPVVADSSSHAVEALADGIVPVLGPDGKPLPSAPQSQNFALRQGNVVPPEAAKGAVAVTTPAIVSPPAASEPTRERLVETGNGRLVPSAPFALIEAAPIKSPPSLLELGAARSDSSDKPADTKHSKVTLVGVTTISGAKQALAKAPGFAFASPSPDAAAAGSESQNYHWGYDTSSQPGLATSDGDKVPILGDVPLVGRFYRNQLESEGVGGRAGAQAGTPMTPAQAGQQEGVALNLAGTTPALDQADRPVNGALANQLAAKMPFPEDASRSVQRQIAKVQDELPDAQRELLERKAMPGIMAPGQTSGNETSVPTDKLSSYSFATRRLEELKRQQSELLRQHDESYPLVQNVGDRIERLTRQKADLEKQYPGLASDANVGGNTVGTDVLAARVATPSSGLRDVQAQASQVTDLYAKQSSVSKMAAAEGASRAQDQVAAGALRLNVEDNAKSVELPANDTKAPEERFAEQSQDVRQAQKKIDDLRAKLQISDQMASGDGPSPLMTADTLHRLESLRIESKAEFVRQQTLLNRLQDLGNEQDAERLASKVLSLSNNLDNLEREIASANSNDMLRAAQAQPYFEAKRTLEELQHSRQPLEQSGAAKANQTNQADVVPSKPAAPAPIPQPEVQSSENAFSTFSLNVSDVSFKLAGASLEKGLMPEPATVRSEEFINAFDYRDPEPPPGVPVAFAWERAQYPFAQNRDLLRFSIKTAALGRQPGRPLNLVLLLDNSGSMERADRVAIIREALRLLAEQLQPQDKLSVITFARTPRLFADGAPGSDAGAIAMALTELTPQGGTNLEDAMNLGYQTALRHYLANGVNRVALLTDGAANLGSVAPEALQQKVEAYRKQGIALDCFGIGWEGYNDDLLEVLSRNGDGRYGFVNTPEEAATEFAGQLAGALHVAASDVKVQVEFNPSRVTAYRQIGYAKHQLTKEQFRDNTVDAAEIGVAESGNALYTVEVNPAGIGPLCTVRARFRIPGTADYREHAWDVPFTGNALPLEQSSPAMRLAATASALSEWLASSPYAGEVTPDRLLGYLSGVPDVYGADARPKKLEWMIRQAKSIAGK
jgi:Mg-chelatase subunit ChlD